MQNSQIMCKAQNNFQLLLVKLFNQTYYCSDTKFWPDICLLCHTSVNPCPSPIYLSGIFPPLLFFCCLLFVPLCSTICSTILFHSFHECSGQVTSNSQSRQFRKLQIFENDVTSQFFCADLPLVLEVKFFFCRQTPIIYYTDYNLKTRNCMSR